jgi:hypothetical protein
MDKVESQMEVVNLLGVFYEHEGKLMVADEQSGALDVASVVTPVITDESVHVLAHHRPPEPPMKDRWGGGSCHLEGSGTCPAGHHERHQWIYSFNVMGRLQTDDEGFVVIAEDGVPHPIRTDFLVGHRAQLVVVSIPNFDQMAEKMRSMNPNNLRDAKLDDLQARATEIRDYLSEINKLKDNL